ncbi:MAG: hypothetical protein OQK67_07930 [Chlorobium sp.]|nr:hypothetical protein [Chlorobium sp.]MCW8815297.1 hypothetical protein [Chlorobium sp.]MCW8819015.1 hypothetical protein [Ignavibacteriaceae bacterium]
MIPKVLLHNFCTTVEIDKKKKDYQDWMIITWDKPLFTIARSSINRIQDYGKFDQWDIVQSIIVGYRRDNTWHQSVTPSSLDTFGGCTGVACKISALMDMRLDVSLEVSLYLDLRVLPTLGSTYPVSVEDWKEITHDEAGRLGLY